MQYSAAAVDDLDRLHDFLLDKNPLAARNAVTAIQEAVAQLQDHPLLGVATTRSPAIRDLIAGDYLIRYLIQTEKQVITVLRIWHGKEDSPMR